MTDQRPNPSASTGRAVYVERVNALIDYIETHLADELTLQELSAVAHFSPYHFHRVFGMLVGETPARFISRLRVERAATLLLQQPNRTVTGIGAEVGLPNPSSFARAFRDAFGMSATQWRRGGFAAYEREPGETAASVRERIGAVDTAYGIIAVDVDGELGSVAWSVNSGSLGVTPVTLEAVPDLSVAYVRHTGRYQGLSEVFSDLFARLMAWAQPRDLVTPTSRVLAVYHDNPSITEDDHLRVSACVTVPAGTATSGDVGAMEIPGGTCAVGSFELGVADYGEAWYALAAGWLPDSGYEPDDRLPYERYFIGRPAPDPEKETVAIYLPVRPLRHY